MTERRWTDETREHGSGANRFNETKRTLAGGGAVVSFKRSRTDADRGGLYAALVKYVDAQPAAVEAALARRNLPRGLFRPGDDRDDPNRDELVDLCVSRLHVDEPHVPPGVWAALAAVPAKAVYFDGCGNHWFSGAAITAGVALNSAARDVRVVRGRVEDVHLAALVDALAADAASAVDALDVSGNCVGPLALRALARLFERGRDRRVRLRVLRFTENAHHFDAASLAEFVAALGRFGTGELSVRWSVNSGRDENAWGAGALAAARARVLALVATPRQHAGSRAAAFARADGDGAASARVLAFLEDVRRAV